MFKCNFIIDNNGAYDKRTYKKTKKILNPYDILGILEKPGEKDSIMNCKMNNNLYTFILYDSKYQEQMKVSLSVNPNTCDKEIIDKLNTLSVKGYKVDHVNRKKDLSDFILIGGLAAVLATCVVLSIPEKEKETGESVSSINEEEREEVIRQVQEEEKARKIASGELLEITGVNGNIGYIENPDFVNKTR